jgi:hypothetical protein
LPLTRQTVQRQCRGDAINFDGTASANLSPNVTYGWDLDGDGQFDDASGPTVSFTYDKP